MLINGKEIEYNPKTSATIQHEINRLSDLDQSLKSDLQKPQTILNPNFTSGALADFEFNNNGFFISICNAFYACGWWRKRCIASHGTYCCIKLSLAYA